MSISETRTFATRIKEPQKLETHLRTKPHEDPKVKAKKKQGEDFTEGYFIPACRREREKINGAR